MTQGILAPEGWSERIGRHIVALEGVRHPLAAPEALERAADYAARELTALGYQVSEQLFPAHDRMFRNIVATLPGIGCPEERVLVVAHYDTVANSPGADDNASGTAGLLEIARRLAGASFERTLQFVAVCLEENQITGNRETGLMGSKALAELAVGEAWQIAGVLVLESIGYAGPGLVQQAPPGLPVQVSEVGDFIAVVANERSRELAETYVAAAQAPGIELPYLLMVVPGNGEPFPDTRRSDHSPFWDRGYPALMLTDTTNFRSPHYHEPSDTLETLNLDFAAQVCRAATGAVLDLARLRP
ncbi:peptidase M28 [Geomonas limicola]|uniref:Peptidase M28 n=1 Tax=Geomonas limicola TaxID=2740186 RepID=A0A6V8N6X3_9BACT|nr:M28 family peptidase [Geomonas limicola]GFO67587.1 peptidase M28 [Geomonas limicola]